jgi:DNA polymerase III sliding clamp (beta) subunit (PCNA family)
MAKKKASPKKPKKTKKPKVKKEIELVFENGALFKDTIDCVASIIKEIEMIVTPNGMSMTSMDLSHICLVALTLAKEDFDTYKVDFSSVEIPEEIEDDEDLDEDDDLVDLDDDDYEEEEFVPSISLGIGIENLAKILKRIKPKESVSLTKLETEKKVTITLKGEKKSRNYNLALIDLQGREINLDTLNALEYKSIGKTKTEVLDEAIKDAELFSEVLSIGTQNNTFIFESAGTIGDFSEEVDKEFVSFEKYEDLKSGHYAISFLKNIVKSKSIIDDITIKYSRTIIGDEEISSALCIRGGFLENSELLYYLAPRIEENEETGGDGGDFSQK